MLPALADILSTLPQIIVSGMIVGKFIQAKNNKEFICIYVLMSLLIYIITGYVLDRTYAIRGTLSIAVQIVLVISCCRIPRAHGLAYMLMANVCMFLAEIPFDLAILYLVPNFSVLFQNPSWLVTWKLMYLPLVVVSYVCPFWLCQRLFKIDGDSEISKYIPFLVIQALLVILPMFMALSFTEHYSRICGMCVIYLMANVGLDLLLMHTFGKINRSHILELQHEQSQNLLQAQVNYYNELQDNARLIRQIRHDMTNQLQTLSILLEDGSIILAQEQLASLRDTISRTGENIHTGNPVVDAVIELKQGVCVETGICLQCSGKLPTKIGVNAENLCSIVANLLDNAIHACHSTCTDTSPVIHFSVNAKNDVVVFCCENPAPSTSSTLHTEPSINKEHGWGLAILRNIAETYHGDFQVQLQNGTVQAILWLTPQPQQEGGVS